MSKAHYLRTPPHTPWAFILKHPVVIMDFGLHPSVTLHERSYNVLVALREHFIEMLNRNLNLQRFKVLFVTGNFSDILSRLHRRFMELKAQ